MAVNWEEVTINALTSIRMTWGVDKLQRMEREGHETPASGDIIAEQRDFLKLLPEERERRRHYLIRTGSAAGAARKAADMSLHLSEWDFVWNCSLLSHEDHDTVEVFEKTEETIDTPPVRR